MEARSRSSNAPVLPITFAIPRSHSPTRHFNSPSSSSAFNYVVHRTLSPTRASFRGPSSIISSASAATSSSINFALDRSASHVRSARPPVSPKGGTAMKPVPCAPTTKTCMCSRISHPGSFRCSLHRNISNSSSSAFSSECEEVRYDEFAGKDWSCGRRMGQKIPHSSHTPLQAPHANEDVFSATAQQAMPYDHGRRCLLKLASGCSSFKTQLRPVSPIVSLMVDD